MGPGPPLQCDMRDMQPTVSSIVSYTAAPRERAKRRHSRVPEPAGGLG